MADSKLTLRLFQKKDVTALGRELLGKLLCTFINGHLRKAIISETEAYAGESDRASHAYGGRRTPRTETMYGAGGRAYVYLCYGVHHLFNVVTNVEGVPHAVLVRAVLPLVGADMMRARRQRRANDLLLFNGPGKVTQALDITTAHDGTPLCGGTIWLEDPGRPIHETCVLVGPRVGVDYAGEDAGLPYRFRLTNSCCRQLLATWPQQ